MTDDSNNLYPVQARYRNRITQGDRMEYICCREGGERSLGTVTYANCGFVITSCDDCQQGEVWNFLPTGPQCIGCEADLEETGEMEEIQIPGRGTELILCPSCAQHVREQV